MAILQGIISLLTRSVGKIVSALFDWAVVALFGRVEGRQNHPGLPIVVREGDHVGIG